jgi:hypothetical protein
MKPRITRIYADQAGENWSREMEPVWPMNRIGTLKTQKNLRSARTFSNIAERIYADQAGDRFS